jgi:NAD(P)H-hydrate epimerase
MERYEPSDAKGVMSREEVRAVDRWAIEEVGVSGVVLMENAGRSCAELVRERLGGVERPRVCIFCGTGNNGGDGYVIARHLLNAAFGVRVVVCGAREKIGGDARINLEILERLGHEIEVLDPAATDVAGRVGALADGADMVVDALFGTGLRGPLRVDYAALVDAINGLGVPILAVDFPSGLDCDTGKPLGTAIRAACTVTFVAAKRGFAASGGAGAYTGPIYVASIGVEAPSSGPAG